MTTWQLDPSHSTLGFSVKHLMISTVRGRFADFSGAVTLDEAAPGNSSVEVTIDAASIDTRSEQRDNHLRSADFFDSATFPQLTFKSTRVQGDVSGDFTVFGDLTIRGVTREVALRGSYEGAGRDPWGNERKAYNLSTKINREEFGLTWNQALETGGLLVSPEVKIEIEAQVLKAQQSQKAA